MRYVPFSQLAQEAHVLVGGLPRPSTRIHLSNEKSNHTDIRFKADLCAESAFKFLAEGEPASDQEPISADRFDGDRLAAIFALSYPDEANSLKDQLIGVARAFSFETSLDLDNAHRAFVLRAWTEPDLSPLNKGVFQNSEPVIASILYEELLPRLPKILEKVDYLERYWVDQDRVMEASEELFIKNEISIEEFSSLDLAIVEASGLDVPSSLTLGLHSIPIHNRTACSRILILRNQKASFYYRAESGLDFISRAVPPRIDLTKLSEHLNELENGNGAWLCEPLSSFKPFLFRDGQERSKVSNAAFKNLLLEVLSTASP
jgi:hypothetical protein